MPHTHQDTHVSQHTHYTHSHTVQTHTNMLHTYHISHTTYKHAHIHPTHTDNPMHTYYHHTHTHTPHYTHPRITHTSVCLCLGSSALFSSGQAGRHRVRVAGHSAFWLGVENPQITEFRVDGLLPLNRQPHHSPAGNNREPRVSSPLPVSQKFAPHLAGWPWPWSTCALGVATLARAAIRAKGSARVAELTPSWAHHAHVPTELPYHVPLTLT